MTDAYTRFVEAADRIEEIRVDLDAVRNLPRTHPDRRAELFRLAALLPPAIASFRSAAADTGYATGIGFGVVGSAPGGYFQTRLRDGTTGYFQRRTDDCFQAQVASYVQSPPHQVPDLRLDEQMRAGKQVDEIDRYFNATMSGWASRHGLRFRLHATPPTWAKRWIGLVYSGEPYNDHCLLMSGRDCLFDAANLLPPGPDEPATLYDTANIHFGITIERS